MTRDDYDAALIAIAVWLRFSAARHLTWNRNYNVKPLEIGAAQVCACMYFEALQGHAVACTSDSACIQACEVQCRKVKILRLLNSGKNAGSWHLGTSP